MKNILKNPDVKILIEFFPERLQKAKDSPREFLEYLLNNEFSVLDLRKNINLTYDVIDEWVNFYDLS